MPCYKRKEIEKLLRSMSTPQIVEIHNRYRKTTNCPDKEIIYSMSDFDKVFAWATPWAVAQTIYCKITQDEFHLYETYFGFNKYGDIVSFNDARRYPSLVDFYHIAVYIDDTGDALGSDEIQNLLDEPGEYQKLRAAVDTAPTQENVNALGEWLLLRYYFQTGGAVLHCSWESDEYYYDCGDGICLSCVWSEGGEDEDDEIVGFKIRKTDSIDSKEEQQ